LGIKAIERTLLPIAMVAMSDGNKTQYTRKLKNNSVHFEPDLIYKRWK